MGLDEYLKVAHRGIAALSLASALYAAPLEAQFAPERTSFREAAASPSLSNRYSVSRRKTDPRAGTKYIVVHWTDDNFAPKYIQRKKLANYIVNRDGTIFRAVHHRDYAWHAGESRWNGLEDLSNYSVGIEVVSMGTNGFTDKQYKSLRWLIRQLQGIYRLSDDAVLSHAEVAYPRGRKVDPLCLPWRERIGLKAKVDEYGRHIDPEEGKIRPSAIHEFMLENGLCTEKQVRLALQDTTIPLSERIKVETEMSVLKLRAIAAR